MNETTDRELTLEDEDRLPWLEAVDSDDDKSVSTSKLLGLLASAALLLAVVVGGVWWWRNQAGAGDDKRIAASQDPYKVPVEDGGGMKVEGQGDTALATSDGAEANGKLDTAGQAEAPVAGTKQAPVTAAPATSTASAATAPVANGGALAAPAATPAVAAPAATAPAAAAPGTGLIQLGAYNSEAAANQAYGVLTGKHGALAGLGKTVVPAAVNGTTMYRLRVSAGANAAGVCAKLKAGGANCMVVR